MRRAREARSRTPRPPDLRRHPRRGRALRPALRRHAAPDQRTVARHAMARPRAGIDPRPSLDPAHGGPARWRQLGVARRSGRRPGFRRTHLSQRVRPRWRLLIIGANQTAQVLASVAATLDFHVTVCDPREEFHGDWNQSQATLLASMPDDAVLEIGTDERTAIVAVTHDPKLDDMALLEALKSPRSTWARWGRAPTSKAPRAAAAIRPGREPDRTPAWPGGPAHREQNAGRDRGGDRRRTDLGPQHAGRRRSRLQALASQRAPGLSRAAGPAPRGPAYMGLSVVRLY